MAQFDVFQNARGGAFPLLLDVQAEVLARLESRVVVPLALRKKFPAKPISRLHPIVVVSGAEYVALFHQLAAYPASGLGQPVGSIAHQRNVLIAALDLLFTGA